MIKDAPHRDRCGAAPSIRHGRFLSLIVIGVLLIAVPGVFLISITPRSLLFVVVPTTRLPWLVRVSLTVPLIPGWMFATPPANRKKRPCALAEA